LEEKFKIFFIKNAASAESFAPGGDAMAKSILDRGGDFDIIAFGTFLRNIIKR